MKLVDAGGNPVGTSTQPNDGTEFDKAPPTQPPTPQVRSVPEWFQEVHDYLARIVGDESIVVDLCLERCVDIVRTQHDRGLVGIDHFPEASGGQAPTRMGMMAIASPLCVELYKQVIAEVSSDAANYKEMIKRAVAKRESQHPGA